LAVNDGNSIGGCSILSQHIWIVGAL